MTTAAKTPPARPGRPRSAARASDGARYHFNPLCPSAPEHGELIPWPTDRWGWMCIHQAHDGWREVPPTRAFFTSAEAEDGLSPASRPAAETSFPDDAPPPTASPAAVGSRPQLGAPDLPTDASLADPAAASPQPTVAIAAAAPVPGLPQPEAATA